MTQTTIVDPNSRNKGDYWYLHSAWADRVSGEEVYYRTFPEITLIQIDANPFEASTCMEDRCQPEIEFYYVYGFARSFKSDVKCRFLDQNAKQIGEIDIGGCTLYRATTLIEKWLKDNNR